MSKTIIHKNTARGGRLVQLEFRPVSPRLCLMTISQPSADDSPEVFTLTANDLDELIALATDARKQIG